MKLTVVLYCLNLLAYNICMYLFEKMCNYFMISVNLLKDLCIMVYALTDATTICYLVLLCVFYSIMFHMCQSIIQDIIIWDKNCIENCNKSNTKEKYLRMCSGPINASYKALKLSEVHLAQHRVYLKKEMHRNSDWYHLKRSRVSQFILCTFSL